MLPCVLARIVVPLGGFVSGSGSHSVVVGLGTSSRVGPAPQFAIRNRALIPFAGFTGWWLNGFAWKTFGFVSEIWVEPDGWSDPMSWPLRETPSTRHAGSGGSKLPELVSLKVSQPLGAGAAFAKDHHRPG